MGWCGGRGGRHLACRTIALVHRLHSRHLRNMILEVSLDPHLECHLARRAPDAGAVEPNGDDALLAHAYQLDIAPVALHSGSDQLKYPRNALESITAHGRGFAQSPLRKRGGGGGGANRNEKMVSIPTADGVILASAGAWGYTQCEEEP